MPEPANLWHPEVLSAAQAQALDRTRSVLTDSVHVFLAGGTGLALRFGHRRSRDLDWFTSEPFDHIAMAARLRTLPGATITHAEPGTIHGICDGIAISLIRYRYAVAPSDHCGQTPISALRTAAGMKLLALVNRGYKRDFIDIAAIISHGHDLATLMQWTVADIPGMTSESMLRALAWLDDAEQQPHPDGVDDKTWLTTKRLMEKVVRDCVMHMGERVKDSP